MHCGEQCNIEFKNMENNMNTKIITLLILFHFHSTLISMEIISPLLKTIPLEIKQEISSFVITSPWWYLDKTFQHDKWVSSACFDPSSKLLATASDDEKARIFDIQTNTEIASFQHNDYVYSACFDPSGKLLATASYKKAHIFDIQTKTEISSFQHDDSVFSACFDPSGKFLATASDDCKARIFARYDNYTLEQLILKKLLLNWLLIEKPNKTIDDVEKLFTDIEIKYDIPFLELVLIWSTFPEDMLDALWRTMQHRIQKYGK